MRASGELTRILDEARCTDLERNTLGDWLTLRSEYLVPEITGEGLDKRDAGRGENPLHRARKLLGERLCGELQRQTQGRVPRPRDLLQPQGGAAAYRAMARAVQRDPPT